MFVQYVVVFCTNVLPKADNSVNQYVSFLELTLALLEMTLPVMDLNTKYAEQKRG